MQKEILTIGEAAGFLRISKKSVYKLAKEGRVPCKKILNKWRFEKESLKAWVGDGESRNDLIERSLETDQESQKESKDKT